MAIILLLFIFIGSVFVDLLPGFILSKIYKEKNKDKIKYDIADNFGFFFFKRILYFSLPVLMTLIVQFFL